MAAAVANLNAELIPLKPQSIVDFAWGLSLFFSSDEQEKKYGEDLKKKWDDLVKEYEGNNKATQYLENVYATMSGTVYSLAYLRQQVTDQFDFLEGLKERRLSDLDGLANLSKNAESIAVRVVGLSIGGGAFLQFAANALGPKEVAYGVLGAGIAYFILEIFLRAYRTYNAPRILIYIQKEKEAYLKNQYEPKSQKFLSELLERVSAISKEIYGEQTAIIPGVITKLSTGSATLHSSLFITGSGAISPYSVPPNSNPTQHAGSSG